MMFNTSLCYIAIALWIVVSIGIFLIYLLIKGQKKRIKDENLNSVSTISPARFSESTSDETLYSFVEEANVIDTTSYRSVTTFNDTNRFQPYLGKFDILFSVYKCKYLKIILNYRRDSESCYCLNFNITDPSAPPLSSSDSSFDIEEEIDMDLPPPYPGRSTVVCFINIFKPSFKHIFI